MARRLTHDHPDRVAATELVEALAAIEDRVLRRGALFERLARLEAEAAAAVLNGLLALAVERHATAVAVVPLVSEGTVLAETLGQGRVAAILAAARATRRLEVVRLFVSTPPRRTTEGPDDPTRQGPMASLPLGWRTQLGRLGSRDVMDRLVYDQNPRVIENLLRNDRCTEREALRIAAHRPTSAAVLSIVFRHPKWIQRYRVKRALALNPHATPAQVLSLLPSLLTQDLELIAKDETLHRDVAQAAATLVAARRGEPAPEPPAARRERAAPPPEPLAVEEESGGVIETPPELRAAMEEALRELESVESLAEAAGLAAAEGAPEASRQGNGAPGADPGPGRPPDDPAADR